MNPVPTTASFFPVKRCVLCLGFLHLFTNFIMAAETELLRFLAQEMYLIRRMSVMTLYTVAHNCWVMTILTVHHLLFMAGGT
jgi:hypothetical protein